MAKIKMSPLVTDIKGSSGPLLFSESRGVRTVRAKKTPSNPNTAAQQASRGALRDLMTIWEQLHYWLQDRWTDYAAGLNMTAVNAFLAQNLAIENGNSRFSITPPGTLPVLTASGIYESSGCANVSFGFTPGTVPVGQILTVWHRLGNKPGPPGPLLTPSFFVGPQTSPVSVPVPDCGEGDNWLYASLVTAQYAEIGFGFGVFLDII